MPGRSLYNPCRTQVPESVSAAAQLENPCASHDCTRRRARAIARCRGAGPDHCLRLFPGEMSSRFLDCAGLCNLLSFLKVTCGGGSTRGSCWEELVFELLKLKVLLRNPCRPRPRTDCLGRWAHSARASLFAPRLQPNGQEANDWH